MIGIRIQSLMSSPLFHSFATPEAGLIWSFVSDSPVLYLQYLVKLFQGWALHLADLDVRLLVSLVLFLETRCLFQPNTILLMRAENIVIDEVHNLGVSFSEYKRYVLDLLCGSS